MYPIPSELREAMKEVHEIITEAKLDRDIAIDFDDAIQVDGLCGRKVGTKKRPFEFTFSPEGDADQGWRNLLYICARSKSSATAL